MNKPLQSGEGPPVTRCDQVKRKICAEDNCQIVEGELEVIGDNLERIIAIFLFSVKMLQ